MNIDFRDPQQLEAFLLEQIRRKSELAKLDFKRDFDLSDKRQALDIVKDINAIANTFAQEFGDWGFLIFGMNRDDGKVTHEVKAFRELGADKLENSLAQKVQGAMKPAPRFVVHQFDQEGVGAWGVIVIEPGQPGPVVFAKKEQHKGSDGRNVQVWDLGDWFIRTDQATTRRPTPEDYVQMIRGQIMAATAPLQHRIDDLERQVLRLEGRLEETRQSERAKVELEVVDEHGRKLTQLPQISRAEAKAQLDESWRAELRDKVDKMMAAPPLLMEFHFGRGLSEIALDLGKDLGPVSPQPDRATLTVPENQLTVAELRRKIEDVLGATPDEYWSFPDMELRKFEDKSISGRLYSLNITATGVGHRQFRPVEKWVGPDAKRYHYLADLEAHFNFKSNHQRFGLQKFSSFPIHLRLRNNSETSTGDFQVVYVAGVPLAHPEHPTLYSGRLLPDEAAKSEQLHLNVLDAQEFTLQLRVLGERLGRAQDLTWSFEPIEASDFPAEEMEVASERPN